MVELKISSYFVFKAKSLCFSNYISSKQLHTDLSNPFKRERLEEREEIRPRYEHCLMVRMKQICPSRNRFLTRHTEVLLELSKILQEDNFKEQKGIK